MIKKYFIFHYSSILLWNTLFSEIPIIRIHRKKFEFSKVSVNVQKEFRRSGLMSHWKYNSRSYPLDSIEYHIWQLCCSVEYISSFLYITLWCCFLCFSFCHSSVHLPHNLSDSSIIKWSFECTVTSLHDRIITQSC